MENLDLTKILKNCPKGWKFYSTVLGEVSFVEINNDEYHSIIVKPKDDVVESFAIDGKMIAHFDGECTLFPSKNQRDWSKFTAPWYKIEKFDPKTLKPFDKVLVRDDIVHLWKCSYFSHIDNTAIYKYNCATMQHRLCIPYNDETKHLVGTSDEAPEYYRYWEE